MEESKVLEAALKSCQLLELSLRDSIKEVQRLNLRYNIDWFVNNYEVYVANIWTQYQSLNENQTPPALTQKHKLSFIKTRSGKCHRGNGVKSHKSSNTAATLALNTRSSNELVGSNRRINYKFLKIKRGMEASLVQLQHAIDIANRQKNFMHLNVSGRDTKVRVCYHWRRYVRASQRGRIT